MEKKLSKNSFLNEFKTQFIFEITFIILLMKTLKMSDIFAYWKKLLAKSAQVAI